MLLVLFGSSMPQSKEVTAFVPFEFQYTATPTALTEPVFPSVLFVTSEDTTGPRKESRNVYASSPIVAATSILSCLCITHRFHIES